MRQLFSRLCPLISSGQTVLIEGLKEISCSSLYNFITGLIVVAFACIKTIKFNIPLTNEQIPQAMIGDAINTDIINPQVLNDELTSLKMSVHFYYQYIKYIYMILTNIIVNSFNFYKHHLKTFFLSFIQSISVYFKSKCLTDLCLSFSSSLLTIISYQFISF